MNYLCRDAFWQSGINNHGCVRILCHNIRSRIILLMNVCYRVKFQMRAQIIQRVCFECYNENKRIGIVNGWRVRMRNIPPLRQLIAIIFWHLNPEWPWKCASACTKITKHTHWTHFKFEIPIFHMCIVHYVSAHISTQNAYLLNCFSVNIWRYCAAN